jgi:hypothetical protein
VDVLHNIEARSCNHCCSGRAYSIPYSDTYPAYNCACAVLSSVACPSLQYFSTLPRKRYDFQKRVAEHNVHVTIYLQLLCETFLFLRELSEIDEICMYVYIYVCVYIYIYIYIFVLVRF